MTEYSREPPRKHLRLYLTFDDRTSQGEPIDISPHGHDGAVTGTTNVSPGSVGQGFDFDGSTYISLPSGILTDTDDFTVAFYVDPTDRPDEQRLFALRADITLAFRLQSDDTLQVWTGTWHTIGTVTEPTHVSLTHDATTDENIVRVDGDRTLSYTEAVGSGANVNVLGADATNTAQFRAHSTLDEVRVYKTILPDSQLEDLYKIGAVHAQVDNLGDAWDNPGIPYRVGAPNANLSGALAEGHDYAFRQLDHLRDSIHIDHAAGVDLDRIGSGHGILRRTGEADAVYRARIKATLAAGRSRGTFDDLLQTTAIILDTTEDRIFIDEQFDTDPATAFIYVRTEDLNDAELSAGDVTSILQDAVPGGHDVQVVEQGANPFTVINDTQANDPEQGLTSDSIATGGGLASDA